MSTAVDFKSRLPDLVFRAPWNEFLFFDPEFLFSSNFVSTLGVLFDSESSDSCCLARVPNNPPLTEATEFFRIDRNSSFGDYDSRLRDRDGVDAALLHLDRFVATTNVGDWCIYAEGQEDIGILALRKPLSMDLCRIGIATIKAFPLAQFLEFRAFKKLLPQWRDGLLRHYS